MGSRSPERGKAILALARSYTVVIITTIRIASQIRRNPLIAQG